MLLCRKARYPIEYSIRQPGGVYSNFSDVKLRRTFHFYTNTNEEPGQQSWFDYFRIEQESVPHASNYYPNFVRRRLM